MSKTVDERIVSMQFDNKQFEENASTSINTLEKLKKSLGFEGASKGLQQVSVAMKGVDTSSLGNGVDTIKAKFSALEVVAVTTLANLTNSAVNTGKKLVRAFTIDPVKTGLQEYETQINAVQTILANTSSKGTTLDQVNAALDELNKYADLTIYNFTEMTRNIGTFTAAGLDLKTSTSAIQGIANVAAVSGSTSQQASTAMYQLSQALSSGTVKLQDWNSVVNAGMGGQVFQDALKATSKECVEVAKRVNDMSEAEQKAYKEQHNYTDDQLKAVKEYGFNVDDIIEKNGSFRESLQAGWITSDVLARTLNKFTKSGAIEYIAEMTGKSEESVKKLQDLGESAGYDSAEFKKMAMSLADNDKAMYKNITDVIKMADTAENAATKVKTFTQLMDTLKEAAQSGWTQTWEILVGDFEEAKALYTSISDTVSNFLNNVSNARNDMLQGWKDMGGRTKALDSLKNIFTGLLNIIKPVYEAFREIFPPTTSKQLMSLTEGFEQITITFKNFTEKIAPGIKSAFTGIFAVLKVVVTVLSAVVKGVFQLATNFSGVVSIIINAAGAIGEALGNLYKSATGKGGLFQNLSDGVRSFASTLKTKLTPVINGLKNIFAWISENISFSDIFFGFASGGVILTIKKLLGTFDSFKGVIEDFQKRVNDVGKSFGKGGLIGMLFGTEREDPKSAVSEVLDSLKGALNSFTSGVKVASLVAISVAVGTLTASLKTLAGISADKIAIGLGAIKFMLISLTDSFNTLTSSMSTFKRGKVIKAGIALMAMAEAVNILANAMTKLAKLSWNGIAKGLIAVAGSMKILTEALGSMSGNKASLKSAATMLALAEACKMIAEPLEKIGKMSWGEIARGLTGMAGALAEMTGVVTAMSYIGKAGKSLAGSVSIAVISSSLDRIAEAMFKFCEMNWAEIKRSLTAMGAAVTELGVVTTIVGRIGKGWAVLGGISIDAIAISLTPIANAMKKFGSMSWGSIAKGLVAMGGAVVELGAIATAIGKVGKGWSLLGAASIDLISLGLGKIANALQKIGSMSWGDIARGLVGMGAALAELAVMNLANTFGMLGALSYDVVSLGLGQIADAFKKFGSMSWDQVANGLIAMRGALAELAAMDLVNTFGMLGAISYDVVAQGLGQIADAFKKFASMSWDEVKSGLAAMGGALAEIAAGDFVNTFGKFGANTIATVAEPLGVLADSIKKWKDVTIPEGLSDKLSILAGAIRSFTFDGLGAGVMTTAAEAVGKMADGISKWENVNVPKSVIESMQTIADGVKKFTIIGAAKLAAIATPLVNFSKAMSTFSKIQGDASGTIKLAENIKEASEKVAGINLISVKVASTAIETLAKALGKASKTDVSGVEKFVNAANKLNKIDVEDVNVSGVSSAVNKVSSAMKKMSSTISNSKSSIANSMKSALSGAASSVDTSAFTKAGQSAANALTKGVTSKKGAVSSAVKSVINSAASSAKSYATSFRSVGSALGEGIKVGLESQRSSIVAKAASIAREAAAAAKKGAKVNSPSKLTIPVGSAIGEGLVVGMQNISHTVTKTGEKLGFEAATCLSGAMQTVQNLLDGDMDTNPTITPVLDLSDVQNGIGTMGSMFDSNDYALSAVGTISRTMSSRGGNDIYSAIADLKNVLSGKTGDTYNINGVTYDDGSNIRGAVESIVQAAKIERRS